MATTTAGVIRDKIISVMEALIPVALPNSGPDNRFKHFLYDGTTDFVEWAKKNPNAAFRRFGVRGDPERLSDVHNVDVSAQIVTFHLVVAYPQNARTGKNALSRDDAMASDQKQIEQAIGLPGYGNFPNASWVSASPPARLIADACDFLVFQQTMRFYRSFP